MIGPHGGDLVDRTVDAPPEDIEDAPSIRLDADTLKDARNIANGRFSPLEGFMTRDDFLKVVADMTLEDGTVWPLPVVLDVDTELASSLTPGQRAVLTDPDGSPVGEIEVEEVFKVNKRDVTAEIFGTDDESHPGVAAFLAKNDFFVGGPIRMRESGRFNGHDLHPAESRVLFRKKGWDSVVGFQTRNAPHRAHEYIQKSALEFVDGLLVQPKLGQKKPGDYRNEYIIAGYRALIEHYYPEDQVALSVFPSKMRYAGPREAVFDAIIRKNQGCTHFIIGRDHAGVGDYYDGLDAHRIFERVSDLGIEPLFFNFSFFCRACDGMASEKVCPHGDDERVYPSGSAIRETIRDGETPSEKMMRPEVARVISDADEPFID